MKNEDKDVAIQKIEQLLEEAPLNDIKYQMNHYVEDFIYNASLLQRNLEYGICDQCFKDDIKSCDKCLLYLKKQELYKELTRAKAVSRRNKREEKLIKTIFWSAKCLFSFLVFAIAIFGITFDSIAKKLFYNGLSYTAIYLREQELKCLHIDFTREYIENELGKPKNITEIQIFDNSFYRTIYTDKYYTVLCYYNDIGSLIGYMIIGNTDDFRYQFYRSDIELCRNSVSEAREILTDEGISGEYIIKEKFAGGRIDNNLYYYECKMQHVLGGQEDCYIGFGFTDIGYLSEEIEPNLNVENVKINFITVFKGYNYNDCYGADGYYTLDFIDDFLINEAYAGLSKGELANLLEDVEYNKRINEYLK